MLAVALVLLLLCISSYGRSLVRPLLAVIAIIALVLLNSAQLVLASTAARRCMVCQRRTFMGLDSNDLDRFRVTTNMPQSYCANVEEIVCDRDQDVCVRITMNMGAEAGFWIGMGCDTSKNFPHLGCEDMKEPTKTISLDREMQNGKPIIQERRALQRVCVCRTDNCNGARPSREMSKWTLFSVFVVGCVTARRLVLDNRL
uniref:Protein quiver n=1 Tax=Plectus sambesii TaxID=2011161 RepID=A0A914VTR6_9BILA